MHQAPVSSMPFDPQDAAGGSVETRCQGGLSVRRMPLVQVMCPKPVWLSFLAMLPGVLMLPDPGQMDAVTARRWRFSWTILIIVAYLVVCPLEDISYPESAGITPLGGYLTPHICVIVDIVIYVKLQVVFWRFSAEVGA
jgi:hypothetical protein